MMKYEQNQRLMQQLMGLNDSFTLVGGSILMMTPLPTISLAYSSLDHEEKQREVHATTQFNNDTASLNAVSQAKGKSERKGEQRKFSPSQSTVICDHCKKQGHMKERCFQIIGFPSNFKNYKGKRMAHNAEVNQDFNSPISNVTGSSSLSPEQYQQIVALLDGLKQKEDSVQTGSSVNFAGPFSEEANGNW